MIQEVDALVQRLLAVHRRAQRRAGTVGPDQGVEADVVRLVVAVIDEACVARIEVHRMQAAVEVHGGTGILGQLQQRGVEILAMDRPDHFAVIAPVALQLRFALARVNHAPAHHHRLGHDRIFDTGLAQRVSATLGQGQIDRTAGLVIAHARIAAALIQGDLPALAGQQDGQQ